jgi:hypothetical protein
MYRLCTVSHCIDILWCKVSHCTDMLWCTVSHCTDMLWCTVSHFTDIVWCTVSHFTEILLCTVSHFTDILWCTVSHYTDILCCTVSRTLCFIIPITTFFETSAANCRGCHIATHTGAGDLLVICAQTQTLLWNPRDNSLLQLYRIRTIWNLNLRKGSCIHTKTWWDAILLSWARDVNQFVLLSTVVRTFSAKMNTDYRLKSPAVNFYVLLKMFVTAR